MKHLLLSLFFLSFSTVVFSQSCIDCSLIDPNAICTTVYDPVCGCNGITYSNSCVGQTSAGITDWIVGECPQGHVSPCTDVGGVDFGLCQMALGFAKVNGVCTMLSGCSTTGFDGVDYSAAFSLNESDCQADCLCGGTNGLVDATFLDLEIYPSPIKTEFQLLYSSGESVEVNLIDITGRSVLETEAKNRQWIPVKELNDGLYILMISKDGNPILSKRIFKKQ